MFVPGFFALRLGDYPTSSAFFSSAAIILVVTTIIALAMNERKPRSSARLHLVTLCGAYVLLPILAAIPIFNVVGSLSWGQAYFEMLSALTTTGATVFQDPDQIPPAVHLWRGLVSWFGGIMILVAAYAILEPLNLGGFEVRTAFSGAQPGQPSDKRRNDDPSDRIIRVIRLILPIYAGLTLALSIGLIVLGDRPFVAFCHAMAVLSTSGISPVGGLQYSSSHSAGEVLIALFLLFAVTHTLISRIQRNEDNLNPLRDPEVQLAIALVSIVTMLLFLRHFLGALDVGQEDNLENASRAFWGTFFTALSFLTTTGFESTHWTSAQSWSGLNTSALILLTLAMVGGGIATTAGGIKLLRFFALYKHGIREMERLVHPSSIGASGRAGRRIRREGAYIAWMFLMLFYLVLSGVFLLLTLTGLSFESAFVLSTAALSNTGPLSTVFGEGITAYQSLGPRALVVLDMAMIFGRLETLAIVALLNPEYWRR